MKRKKIVLGVLPAVLGMTGATHGAIYIAPPDIDQYKQKTDQAFYDLYQNQNSLFQINPKARPYLNTVPTDQRVLEGYVLPTVKGNVIQGSHLPPNARAILQIRDDAINKIVNVELRTTESGILQVRLRGFPNPCGYSNGPSRTSWCPQPFVEVKGVTIKRWCASGGKYGCTTERRLKKDYYFSATSGDYIERLYVVQASRGCGKYGCDRWGTERFVRLVDVQRRTVNLAKILKEGGIHRIEGIIAVPVVTEDDVTRGTHRRKHK